MYGYIIGKITKISPKNIIVENNGIGYLIIVLPCLHYKKPSIRSRKNMERSIFL